jgi:hypothetical protein
MRLHEYFIDKPDAQNFRSFSRNSREKTRRRVSVVPIAKVLNYHRRGRREIVERGGGRR